MFGRATIRLGIGPHSSFCLFSYTDWVKKCIEYEVEGSIQEVNQKGCGERLCKKFCQAHNLNKEDAMDRSRWKKLIKIG